MLKTRRSFLSLAAAGAAAVPLAACSTIKSIIASPGSVSSLIAKACGVIADLTALTTLIGTFPLGTSAVTIANVFCAALSKPAADRLRGALRVTVNGVATTGGYVVINGVTVPYASQ